MMPENKPMKMQWLTVDGRQVPSILPNHWNEQRNDWDITGTKNPLPIANYTQNASGVWLPTSKDNPVPTQLTGSNVEEVLAFNSLAITDTSRQFSSAIDTSKYKKVTVVARSTLNTPVSLGLLRSGTSLWYRVWDGDQSTRLAPPDNQIILNQPDEYILNTKLDFLNYPLYSLGLSAQCTEAPTSGALTIRVWGELK